MLFKVSWCKITLCSSHSNRAHFRNLLLILSLNSPNQAKPLKCCAAAVAKIPQPIQTSLWPANCTQKLAQPRDTRWTVHLARFTAHNRPPLAGVSPAIAKWKFCEEFASDSFFFFLLASCSTRRKVPRAIFLLLSYSFPLWNGKSFFRSVLTFCRISFPLSPVCGPNRTLSPTAFGFKIWGERKRKTLQIPQVNQTQGKSLEPAENHVLWKLLKLACLSWWREKRTRETLHAKIVRERAFGGFLLDGKSTVVISWLNFQRSTSSLAATL